MDIFNFLEIIVLAGAALFAAAKSALKFVDLIGKLNTAPNNA